MSKNKKQNSTPRVTAEDRRRRRQQIIFGIMAAILIISWIVSMVATL